MKSGMTRRGIANRIRRLERRLGLDRIQPPGEPREIPPMMQWPQLCALVGEPAQGQTPPDPICVLKDARLVRWLHRVSPQRLEELKQAHAAGQPAPRWEIST